MDNLTQRALGNQNKANANYNSKQQREEEQKALTESPAFIAGFEGGKYQVQRLGQEPVAVGVPVTNGLLQVGQRATMTGQYVDGVPSVKPNPLADTPAANTPGFIFSLDVDWLTIQLRTEVLIAFTKLFRTKKIYYLSPSAPGYFFARSALTEPAVQSALIAVGIKTQGVNSITEAASKNGLFFLDLMQTFYVFTANDFVLLKKIAKKNGVIACGEREGWIPYNNRMLRGVGVRDSVKAEAPTTENDFFRTVSKTPFLEFRGSGNSKFIGLNESEKLVKNALDDDVFAFFRL